MFSRVDLSGEALRQDRSHTWRRRHGARRAGGGVICDVREFAPGPTKDGGPGAASSGADLARRLARLAPTVVFPEAARRTG
jgi:hypothetical protein